jgi:hypothetical protein
VRVRSWLKATGALALLAIGALVLTPQGRLLPETLALLFDIWSVGRPGAAGEAYSGRSTFSYPGPGGDGRVADLYCDPALPPEARLLMVHGMVDAGKDDGRLQALGRAFAGHRIAVMVPDFPGMKALRAAPGDVGEVAAALETLRRIDACAPPGAGAPDAAAQGAGAERRPLQTGVVGFSYSAGPVLLSLERAPHGADFAVLFGGYYDLREVLLFLTTGRYRDLGADYGGEALPEGRWVLLAANAAVLAGPPDDSTLRAIGLRRRKDPGADISDLTGTLGPEARAALALVANTEPERFPGLLDATSPAFKEALDALSPSRRLTAPLDADLFILHGRWDAIIPYTQSLRLAREVRTSGATRLVLLGGFRHARPGRAGESGGWRAAVGYPLDSLRLMGVLQEILERRGRISLTGGGTDGR